MCLWLFNMGDTCRQALRNVPQAPSAMEVVKQANAETKAVSAAGAAAEDRAAKVKAAQMAADLMAQAGEGVPDEQLDEDVDEEDGSEDEEWDAFVDSRMPCVPSNPPCMRRKPTTLLYETMPCMSPIGAHPWHT